MHCKATFSEANNLPQVQTKSAKKGSLPLKTMATPEFDHMSHTLLCMDLLI